MTDWTSERADRLTRLAAALYALAVAVVVWEHVVGPLPGERWLSGWLYHGLDGHAELGRLTGFLGAVGAVAVVVPTVAVVGWFVRREHGAHWAALVPLTVVPALIARLVKSVTDPTELALDRTLPVLLDNGSLPSGHAAYATSMFGLVALLAWTSGRRDIALTAAAFAGAVSIALVVRGSHFPGDVLAGSALGGAWLLTVVMLMAHRRCSA